MINIQKGTKDMLPKDSYKWQKVRDVLVELSRKYNLKEISTPVFESTELFVRSDGDSSDIVNKEMYTFLDKGDRSITLKPEGTAGGARCRHRHRAFGAFCCGNHRADAHHLLGRQRLRSSSDRPRLRCACLRGLRLYLWKKQKS